MNQQMHALLSEEDLATTVLCDLKRVVREYATAATESTCPDIRQMFTDLTNSTLSMQGQLFNVMQQSNMYNTSTPALRQDLDKQAKTYKQTQQGTTQWVQQKLGQQHGNAAYGAMGQQGSQYEQAHQPNYMQ